MSFHGYGWYLSSTAALLYCSYFTHNVIAWMKIAPFFTEPQASFKPTTCKTVRWIYLPSLALTAPVIIFQIFNNFRFFNNISKLYKRVRPYEPLMRDPWWLFSSFTLFYIISKCYNMRVFRMVRKSPRFGILLAAIILAIIFTIMDILASIIRVLSETDGINPYWKLALVFKCLTDNIMLDDFKSVLQRLGAIKLDGTEAMQQNSLNLSPNEKAGAINDDYDVAHVEELRRRGANRKSVDQSHRHSLSGRLLDDGEDLDTDGRARRRQSITAGAVGKLGLKIRQLPRLPFSEGKSERQARHNAEANRHVPDLEADGSAELPESEASTHSFDHSPGTREPWEQVDFITALTEPETERNSWNR